MRRRSTEPNRAFENGNNRYEAPTHKQLVSTLIGLKEGVNGTFWQVCRFLHSREMGAWKAATPRCLARLHSYQRPHYRLYFWNLPSLPCPAYSISTS
jgi:hypothetical protein